jgi:cell wall-associated NlpC family hydrolase
MSVPDVLARIAQIQALAAPAVVPALPVAGPPDAVDRAVAARTFADALAQASSPPAPSSGLDQGSAGARALAYAESQVGQAEESPGSNDGPAIAQYRGAVAGAVPGAPWCAYFVSWAAAQAGSPLGDTGQGLGSVAQIADWAERTGRVLPAGSAPQPGDLILFGDRHVGIVEAVGADGTLTTVEGNESNAVTRRTRAPGEATGFVRL